MLRFACRALLCGRQDEQWVGRADRSCWDTVDDDGVRKGITNSQWRAIQNMLYRGLDDLIGTIDADGISVSDSNGESGDDDNDSRA